MQKCTLVFAMAVALLIILKPQEIEARMTLPQLTNAMKGMARTCVSKTGVDPELAAKTRAGEFPPDRALQCYVLCLYTMIKVAKNGKLNMDVMMKQIDMTMPLDLIARTKEVSQLCYDSLTSTDDCERGWGFSKCIYETDSSIYFFP